jgi:predicted dienelactone hydrolase
MASTARQSRHVPVGGATAVLLSALVFVAACGSSPPQAVTLSPSQVSARHSATHSSGDPGGTSSPTASPSPTTVPGKEGTYGTGETQKTFTRGKRSLPTQIWYPTTLGSSGSHPAPGPFPLLLFAPGFRQCVSAYQHLLQTWATAGYVVAAVTFPHTNCGISDAAANEPDIVNQPADMTFVLTSLLALNAQPGNIFSGLLNPDEVAAAGQSDGGDTVAAMAANPCCRNYQLKAVAVLSGAEWQYKPWKYVSGGEPPMLFTQGSMDQTNLPSASMQLYSADKGGPRYYLALYGATHLDPYEADNSVERFVAHITLEFFDRYVLGDAGALTTMMQDGNASSQAALDSGGQVPANAG